MMTSWGSNSWAIGMRTWIPPELKVSTPAHTKHLGWYVGFEFRVTHHSVDAHVREQRQVEAHTGLDRPELQDIAQTRAAKLDRSDLEEVDVAQAIEEIAEGRERRARCRSSVL